jgi:hypothetical protein
MDKVEIDGDTADRIVVCSLKETMKYLKEDITKYKKYKKLSNYQKEELTDLITHLHHIRAVYEYYGGNLQ